MQTVSLLLTCHHSSLVLLACTIQCFSCVSNHGEQIQDRMCWRLGFQWDTDDFGKWATFMIEFFNVKLKAVKLEGVWKTWKMRWLIFPRRLLAAIPTWSAVVLILWWTFPAFCHISLVNEWSNLWVGRPNLRKQSVTLEHSEAGWHIWGVKTWLWPH